MEQGQLNTPQETLTFTSFLVYPYKRKFTKKTVLNKTKHSLSSSSLWHLKSNKAVVLNSQNKVSSSSSTITLEFQIWGTLKLQHPRDKGNFRLRMVFICKCKISLPPCILSPLEKLQTTRKTSTSRGKVYSLSRKILGSGLNNSFPLEIPKISFWCCCSSVKGLRIKLRIRQSPH